MRYSLRNQHKIKEYYSDKFLNRIKSSLDEAFAANEIEIKETNDKYNLLCINDNGHTCGLIMFYIIGVTYDVYNLAYKDVIN